MHSAMHASSLQSNIHNLIVYVAEYIARHHQFRLPACLLLLMPMQLIERRRGNACYKERQFSEALQRYTNAMSILEPITGRIAEEQQEISTNLAKVYLNIAAVHLQEQHHGTAVHWCTQALIKDANNHKALLRRAKAHLGRHNYQVRLNCASLLLRRSR